MSEGSEGTAAGAVTAPFGARGHFVIMLFIGLYVAPDPQSYRKGLLAFLAPSLQSDGEDLLTRQAMRWQTG